MRKLPIFNGYTIDFRLRELRKIELGEIPEFIPFDSKKGQRLLNEFLTTSEGVAEALYYSDS